MGSVSKGPNEDTEDMRPAVLADIKVLDSRIKGQFAITNNEIDTLKREISSLEFSISNIEVLLYQLIGAVG